MAVTKKFKPTAKDILNATITGFKKQIRPENLTDKQLIALRTKITALCELVEDEYYVRFIKDEVLESVEEDVQDAEDGKYPEDNIDWSDDEVSTDNTEA